MRIASRFLPLALCSLLIGSAHADPLAPGIRLPEIHLDDQHGTSATIGPEVRTVLFTRDMDAGNVVKETLAENGDQILAAAGAVYVSDISGMPGVIAKLFAVPSMRKRPYRMILDRDGKTTADFPSEKGKVTLIYLNGVEIESVDYVDSIDQLRAALTRKVEVDEPPNPLGVAAPAPAE